MEIQQILLAKIKTNFKCTDIYVLVQRNSRAIRNIYFNMYKTQVLFYSFPLEKYSGSAHAGNCPRFELNVSLQHKSSTHLLCRVQLINNVRTICGLYALIRL
jgi:hypothetical protein